MDDLARLLDYLQQTEKQHFIETYAPKDATNEEIAMYELQPYRIDPNHVHVYTLADRVRRNRG